MVQSSLPRSLCHLACQLISLLTAEPISPEAARRKTHSAKLVANARMSATASVQPDGMWKVGSSSSAVWPGIYGMPDTGLARAVQCIVGRGTLLDLGAGAGQYGAFFKSCPAGSRPRWTGFDGNPDIEAFSLKGPPGAWTRPLNLCEAGPDAARSLAGSSAYDWVMSVEVGEHLPARCIPRFLGLLNHSARSGLILSWGTDTRGRGHISPKPVAEVQGLVTALGFVLAPWVGSWLRAHAFAPWLQHNPQVYVRTGGDAHARLLSPGWSPNADAARPRPPASDLVGSEASADARAAVQRCPDPGVPMSRTFTAHSWWRRRVRLFAARNCTAMRRLMPCACEMPDTRATRALQLQGARLRAAGWREPK